MHAQPVARPLPESMMRRKFCDAAVTQISESACQQERQCLARRAQFWLDFFAFFVCSRFPLAAQEIMLVPAPWIIKWFLLLFRGTFAQ